MAKIFTLIVCLFVVIATLKTNGVDGRQNRNKRMDLRSLLRLDELNEENSEEKRRISQSLIVDYKAIKGKVAVERLDCSHIHHSFHQQGACILPLPEAIAYCNADSECDGFGITTNAEYHKTYDRADRMPAVELFKGTKIVKNGEWIYYVKQ